MSESVEPGQTQARIKVSKRLFCAVGCVGFSMLTVVLFLAIRSPYAMFLFALVGQPAFAVGVGLYLWEVLATLKRHREI